MTASTIRAVTRALSVLETVAQSEAPIRLQQCAELTGLDKATAMRMLRTLCATGYVSQDAASKRFCLSDKLGRLVQGRIGDSDLRDLLHPYLAQLRDETGETVHLGVMRGDQVVYIDKLESPRSIRLVSAVGQEMPLYCTALGKVLLAALPDAERDSIVGQSKLKRRTPRTITDASALKRELASILRRGWAMDREENEENATCVAVAVVAASGAVLAAISISGPTFRVAPRAADIASAMQRTLGKIRRKLGPELDVGKRA